VCHHCPAPPSGREGGQRTEERGKRKEGRGKRKDGSRKRESGNEGKNVGRKLEVKDRVLQQIGDGSLSFEEWLVLWVDVEDKGR
jgi:hypothetical protein